MFLVCLAHFAIIYTKTTGVSFGFLSYFTMLDVPIFMIVSGLLLGYFYIAKANRFDYVTTSYVNRGISLLILGHLLIWPSHIIFAHGIIAAFKILHMTDTVGVCILIGPVLIRNLRSNRRIVLSCGIMAASCILCSIWIPRNQIVELIKELLCGSYGELHVLGYAFSLLPWFGLFLASTCIGEKYGTLLNEKGRPQATAFIRKIGFISVGIALSIKGVLLLLKYFNIITYEQAMLLYSITGVYQKTPPSIIYFLFNGGVGLVIMSFLADLPDTMSARFFTNVTSILGRNSLFTFIFQYFVYHTLLLVSGLRYSILWPAYFIVSVLSIIIITKYWESVGGNRFLTIKLFVNRPISRAEFAGNKPENTVLC